MYKDQITVYSWNKKGKIWTKYRTYSTQLIKSKQIIDNISYKTITLIQIQTKSLRKMILEKLKNIIWSNNILRQICRYPVRLDQVLPTNVYFFFTENG